MAGGRCTDRLIDKECACARTSRLEQQDISFLVIFINLEKRDLGIFLADHTRGFPQKISEIRWRFILGPVSYTHLTGGTMNSCCSATGAGCSSGFSVNTS